MLTRDMLMIHFPVFGMTYVQERHNFVEASDRHSLIAECRVQRPSSAPEFDLQARSAEQVRPAEAAANS
jgi:hypothetical protein